MKKVHSIQELKGILSKSERPLSVEEMNQAIEIQACRGFDAPSEAAPIIISALTDEQRQEMSEGLHLILPQNS